MEKSAIRIKYELNKKVYDKIPLDKREFLDDLITTTAGASKITILKDD